MGNDEKVFYPKVNLKIYNNMVNNKKNNSVVISEYPYYIKARKYTYSCKK